MGKIKNRNEGRKRNPFKGSMIIFIPLLLTLFGSSLAFGALSQESNKQILEKAFKMQIPFIENQGQIADEQVRFYAKTFGGAVYVTKKGEMVYSLIKSGSNHNRRKRNIENKPDSEITQVFTFREKLVGSSIRSPEGSEKGETKVNYFIGNDPNKWKTNLTTYEVVGLGEVYQGVDLRLKAYGKNVEKIFTVKPGADPGAIKLKIDGGNSLKINEREELEVQTSLGPVSFAKPFAYQEINGKRVEVKVAYNLEHSTIRIPNSEFVDDSEPRTPNSKLVYGFEVLEYDKSLPLVIDPVLVPTWAYSTYLGGSDDEFSYGVGIDSSGNVYIIGYTFSTNFPTLNPIQGNNAGGNGDVFVTKINPSGSALVYSTYLGGANDDVCTGVAVDGSGNASITGYTNSTNFPTKNPYQANNAGGEDAFVTKINASGSALVYSTYLGGSDKDEGWAIAVDGSGNAYITGYTLSTDFPTQNPIQAGNGGVGDVFVTKINPSGNAFVYSTYLGGSSDDAGRGIAFDGSGNAYITGYTLSTDFPITAEPIQGSNAGVADVFVTKINASGNAFVYSTYLGGSGNDYGYGIAVDGSGNVYLTGQTSSTDFPIIVEPIQGSNAGVADAFVTKINESGNALVYSTYLGGSNDDEGTGIAVDGSGNAYITGYTLSTDFPTQNPIQPIHGGGTYDAFVTKINASGSDLVYSTYLGGSDRDAGTGVAVDGSGNLYLTGHTLSTDFPTVNPIQSSLAGGWDVFVAKIGDRLLTLTKSGTGTGTVTSSLFGINCGPTCTNAQSSFGDGNIVTLTAAPPAGSYFAGWSGDCVSQALTCKVTMDAAKNVIATFTSGTPAVTTWAKTYGGSGTEHAYSIQQTLDGGYIVAGHTNSFGAGETDFWVLKLNADGSVAWQKTYGGSGIEYAYSIQQTSDGGYIVAGSTNSSGAGGDDFWVLKLDTDGGVGWQNTYGGLGGDGATSIQQTSDGGYIVAGSTNSSGAGGDDFWVLKLNADGTVAWQKTYGGTGKDYASSIQETSDGGYIVAGETYSFGAGNSDFWVLKLDADGSVGWQKTYGGLGFDWPYSIQQTSDGGYIVAGHTNSSGAGETDFWVLKLNSDGSVAWEKTYGGSGFEYAYSIQQTSDGGYIVAGETYSFGAGGDDFWVLKLNADGSVAWQKTYGGSANDAARSIQQTSDGGYIVGGGTVSFGAGGYDFWVLKLDSEGNILGCPAGLIGETSVTAIGTTATVTLTAVTGQDTSIIPQLTVATGQGPEFSSGEVCTGVAPGVLLVTAVTAPENFSSSGPYGGPFVPSDKDYTLQNTGGSSIDWTASKSVAWLDLSSSSGTLAAGDSTTVTVSINSNANALGVGPYSDAVFFTNTTDGNGDTTRSVDLTVSKADATTAITGHTPDPSSVGQAVNVSYSVTSTGGTPTGNVTVSASGGSESCTGTVAAGGCSITLTSAGSRTLTATYGGDSNFNGSVSAGAEHTVATPEINVKQGGTDIPTGGSYDFGSVVLGANSPVTFTIENPGTVDLNLMGSPKVQISGANAGDFVVTADPSTPVAASGSTTFVITFTPSGLGSRSATASISNDSGVNPYTFTITGTGIVLAGNYYVNIALGSDSNDGSQSHPWKTLHYAIDQINAGAPGTYILHVALGAYICCADSICEDCSRNITITQSNLTIIGEGATKPLIEGGGSWLTAFEIVNGANNVTIDNLDISGFNSWTYAIIISGANSVIQNCYIHDNHDTGIQISAEATNTTIARNEIFNNASCGIENNDSTANINRNSIYGNGFAGITTYNGGTIQNNLIYSNIVKGIYVQGGTTNIFHNTIDGGGLGGNWGMYFAQCECPAIIAQVMYNIISRSDVGIQVDSGTVTVDYNDLWNNTTDYDGVSPGANNIHQDPLFNPDFTLQGPSPCIDIIPLDSGDPVTNDFNGNPRPQGAGYDMGAYETFKIFTGVGTATIDGVMSPGEWDNADKIDLYVNTPGGGTTPATLYVMNDAANLYLALKFQRNVVDPGNRLWFNFDNNNDGMLENGDDQIAFDPATGFIDNFMTNNSEFPSLCPCPEVACCGISDTDTGVGGTSNGAGAFQNDGTYTVYEMSHPLNSGDTGHDFALNFGDTVGFYFVLYIINTYPGDYGETDFPGLMNFGKIAIVTAPPPYPTLSSPSNGATGVPLNPTLSWNTSVGATTYQVQVSTNPEFNPTLIQAGVIAPATSFDVPPNILNPSMLYYWRVQACNGGSSDWSQVWSFTTSKATTTTVVSSSANPSTYGQSVTFTATVTPNTATGTVQFQIDGSSFGAPVTVLGGMASTSTSALAVGNHPVAAIYSGDSNYNGSTGTLTGGQTVNLAPSYTVATNPPGLHVVVDGATYAGPQTFTWTVGSYHTISTPSPQSGGIGTQYVFLSWSDGGVQGHTITAPSSSTTYTANFTTQYSLTTSVSPPEGGTATPSGVNWYNSGQTVSVLATPSAGYTFWSWSGDLSGSTNPASLLMNGPKNVTANFSVEVAPCDYSIFPTSQNIGKEGGIVSISITTGNVCQWRAWSNASWITMTSGGSGIGSSAVSYLVAANTGPARDGTMTIAGQTFTVHQASGCTYSISPTSQNFGKEGGAGSVSITTGSSCPWDAASNASWITLTSVGGGSAKGSLNIGKKTDASAGSSSGSGSVNYSVAANTGPARDGTMTIAGQTFTVHQASGCTYSISPTSQNFGKEGGAGSVSITTGSSCPWDATSSASWITITSSASGTGNGGVSYSVGANTGPARDGALTIGGQSVTIHQDSGCTYRIDPTSASYPRSGGAGSVGITAGSSCTWVAASNVSWISVAPGAGGTGSGAVDYSVAVNTGLARDGTLTIAGQTFTVHQAEACNVTVKTTYSSYPSSGGAGSITVSASSNTCTWEAVSNASWISITSGSGGTGSGAVNYLVGANTGPARDGTMTIAGQVVTIHEESGCAYAMGPLSASYDSSGGAGAVSVTTENGCTWAAASNVSWILITSGASGTGSGAVNYSVGGNTGPARDGTLTIAGQTFTVHQAAAIYNLTVNITGNGTLRFDPPPPFPAGTKVTVYLEPADGFDVVDIIVDGVSMKAVFPMWPMYTFTFGDFSENHTITIIFG